MSRNNAKHNSERYSKVEVQKGPISMEEQYTYKYMGRPQCIMEDMHNAEMRREQGRLTIHEPKQ